LVFEVELVIRSAGDMREPLKIKKRFYVSLTISVLFLTLLFITLLSHDIKGVEVEKS
jgi:hypothetical protein